MQKLLASISISFLTGLLSAPVYAATLTVPATSDIFAAGLSTPPTLSGGGGTLPPVFSFSANTGQILTFSNVIGSVSSDSVNFFGPDGINREGTNLNSVGGISGIVINGNNGFSLNGVFLDDSGQPSSAPPRLDFTNNTNFASLPAPQLGQTFFIGDGLTGTGTGQVQQFNVPVNATHLYLGFEDGSFSQGTPGTYSDNSGSLTATFDISGSTVSVPEPSSTLGLLTFGAIGAGSWILRKMKKAN